MREVNKNMYTLKIKGHGTAIQITSWLKRQRWHYDLELKHTNPFSDDYDLKLSDQQQVFMTQLKWGLA
jgi:hypothetical protein